MSRERLQTVYLRVRLEPQDLDEVRRSKFGDDPPTQRWFGSHARTVLLTEARDPRRPLIDRLARLQEDNTALRSQVAAQLVTLEQRDQQVRQLLPRTLLDRARTAETDRDDILDALEAALPENVEYCDSTTLEEVVRGLLSTYTDQTEEGATT